MRLFLAEEPQQKEEEEEEDRLWLQFKHASPSHEAADESAERERCLLSSSKILSY